MIPKTCLILAFAVLLGGCVSTHYTKTVMVKRDATGKIVERIETESVTQPGQGWPVKFEYLQHIQP